MEAPSPAFILQSLPELKSLLSRKINAYEGKQEVGQLK